MPQLRQIIRIDKEKLEERLLSAIENFQVMESMQLFDVDIRDCTTDYSKALLICDGNIFSVTFIYD